MDIRISLCFLVATVGATEVNVAPLPDGATPPAWSAGKDLKAKLAFMFEHQLATDVTFLIDNTADNSSYKIGGHRTVLMTASPYLWTTMANTPLAQHVQEATLDKHAMIQMLRFIYSEPLTITEDNVMNVLSAARRYQLTELARRCILFIHQRVDRDNALEFLRKGTDANETAVVEISKHVIAKRAEYVLNSSAFKRISYELLCDILDMPTLAAPEVSIIHAAVEWAKAMAFNGAKVQRAVLAGAFFKLRFPTLRLDQFTEFAYTSGLLSDAEQLQLYRYLSATQQQRTTMKVPYPTEPRAMYSGVEHALILAGLHCGTKLPATETQSILSQTTYLAAFNISSQNNPIEVRGLRVAIPFLVDDGDNVPVGSLSIAVQRVEQGDCERQRYMHSYYDERDYRTVCTTAYVDVHEMLVEQDDVSMTTDRHPFIDMIWGKADAFNLSATPVGYAIQYHFMAPESLAGPYISQIADDFYVQSSDRSVITWSNATSPVRGVFLTSEAKHHQADTYGLADAGSGLVYLEPGMEDLESGVEDLASGMENWFN